MRVWAQALEIASRIRHPNAVAAFAIVLALMAFIYALRNRKPRIAYLLAISILILGLAPLVSLTITTSRGIYHIRIVVLGLDGQPVDDAIITSSIGGELKKGSGNWEFDVPPQAKPLNGALTFYASVSNSFSSGQSEVELGSDFYPTVTVRLANLPQVSIHGVVIGDDGRSVPGASVSVVGYPDIATTDAMGNFSIPSHHAEGQLVSVRAEKGDFVVEESVIAGRDVELVLRRR